MNINRGVIYGLILVVGTGVIIYNNKEQYEVIEQNNILMDDIDKVNYNLDNIYDNIVKMNEVRSLQGDKVSNVNNTTNISNASLLEDDFKRCKFEVLSFWTETYKDNQLYYENEPETTVEESNNSYYLESNGVIEEIPIGEDVANESDFVVLDGAELINESIESDSSETTEVVEEPDIEKTFIIMSTSKYYNSNTTNNITYEIFDGTESIGTTKDKIKLKNLKLDSGYTNSRIDLLELDGIYNIDNLSYQISLSNNENTINLDGLRKMEITEDRVSDEFIVEDIDNGQVVFIKKEPIIGANRIEIIENIRESIVEETIEETSESLLGSVENETKPIGPGETEDNSESMESTANTNVRQKVVQIKETDELFTLSYNFECWGPSTLLKKINNSTVTVVNNQNTEDVIDCINNIQCKFNDSKFNIDESNKFIEFDFAINLQILRSKLNSYLIESGQSEIASNTINTFKNGFDRRFSLKMSNDNMNIILENK